MIDIADKALDLLKQESNPELKICSSSAYWIPLQWLYVRMIENKDLVPISELPEDEKMELWRLVLGLRPDLEFQWTKICLVQAVYVFRNKDVYVKAE